MDPADDNWRAYQRSKEAGHDEYVRKALQCDAYYNGDQWDSDVKRGLEAVKRPALTINAVLSVVNALIGEQVNQRAEVTLRPKRHTNMELADVHTRLMHHILESNNYRYIETQVFSDGVIQDRGYFNVYMDFSDHISGEVRIEALDPLDVLLDPDAKDYDPATWNEVIITRWMTLDEIAVLYGKKAATELDTIGGLNESLGTDSMLTGAENTFGDTEWDNYNPSPDGGGHWQVDKVRVIDRQYRRLERVDMFVDPRTGDMREVPDWPKERIAEFAQQFGMEIIKKLSRKIRWTVSADKVLLHDDWSPYEHFTVVPYFPLFRRGSPSGLVKHLIDPQDQYNKISSQELHVVNTTANSGWIVEAGSLLNMSESDLEERGAETGLVMSIRPGANPPVKILPNNVPAGLDRLAMKAKADLREVSGVDALLGMEKPEVSGVAIKAKQNRALTTAKVPFDNLNRTRTLVAKLILSLVQRFYTEQRVFYITQWDAPKKPATEMEVNKPDPSGQIVNDLTIGEYEVSVAIAPSRESFDDTQFAEVVQLKQAGVLVPDDVVIEYSHLSRRDDIAERVRKMLGGGEPTPQEVQLAQMQMQMQMQMSQAQIMELQARAANLQAQAALAQAKAQAAGDAIDGQAHVEGAKLEFAYQKLQADIVTALADMQNKLDLAKVHSLANLATTQMTVKNRAEMESMKSSLQKKPPSKDKKRDK